MLLRPAKKGIQSKTQSHPNLIFENYSKLFKEMVGSFVNKCSKNQINLKDNLFGKICGSFSEALNTEQPSESQKLRSNLESYLQGKTLYNQETLYYPKLSYSMTKHTGISIENTAPKKRIFNQYQSNFLTLVKEHIGKYFQNPNSFSTGNEKMKEAYTHFCGTICKRSFNASKIEFFKKHRSGQGGPR